jgi:hypothetical protein
MQTSIFIFLMLFACIITNILAIVLPSLQISPLLLIRIAAIVLLGTGALLFYVIYIQAIGSGLSIFSGLFQMTFTLWGHPEQVHEWLSLYLNGNLMHQVPLEVLLLFSLLPVKPAGGLTRRRLTNLEK